MIRSLTIGLLLLSIVAASTALADIERVLWDKQAIPVALAVKEERLIHFPGDVRFWVPESAQMFLRVLSANGVLYIQSLKPFEKTRLRVQEIETQRLYLLDVVSVENGDFPLHLIVTPKAEVTSLAESNSSQVIKVDWPIRLMRYAAQTLYAPERLSPSDSQIRRVAVDSKPVPLFRRGETESTPLGQWAGGGLYVTAVLVRNLTDQSLEIAPTALLVDANADPNHSRRILTLSEDLRGNWLYATAHHSELAPSGDDADRTCLYLISRRSFAEAL